MSPATKFTELRGLDRICQITHEMNCLFRAISQDDVGIDGEIKVEFEGRRPQRYQNEEAEIIRVASQTQPSFTRAKTM